MNVSMRQELSPISLCRRFWNAWRRKSHKAGELCFNTCKHSTHLLAPQKPRHFVMTFTSLLSVRLLVPQSHSILCETAASQKIIAAHFGASMCPQEISVVHVFIHKFPRPEQQSHRTWQKLLSIGLSVFRFSSRTC